MKNQVDIVSITGTRGDKLPVTVVRKGSGWQNRNSQEPCQVTAKAIFNEPPNVRKEPVQLSTQTVEESDLSLFESALASKLNQFQNKRRRGNRHDRSRTDEYFHETKYRSNR